MVGAGTREAKNVMVLRLLPIWVVIVLFFPGGMLSQVATPGFVINFTGGDGDENAVFEVDVAGSPGYGKMGMLIPRVVLDSLTDKNFGLTNTYPLPVYLIIYNLGGVGKPPEGFYYWDGSKWVPFLTGSNPPSGNSHCYTCDGF